MAPRRTVPLGLEDAYAAMNRFSSSNNNETKTSSSSNKRRSLFERPKPKKAAAAMTASSIEEGRSAPVDTTTTRRSPYSYTSHHHHHDDAHDRLGSILDSIDYIESQMDPCSIDDRLWRSHRHAAHSHRSRYHHHTTGESSYHNAVVAFQRANGSGTSKWSMPTTAKKRTAMTGRSQSLPIHHADQHQYAPNNNLDVDRLIDDFDDNDKSRRYHKQSSSMLLAQQGAYNVSIMVANAVIVLSGFFFLGTIAERFFLAW